METDLFRVFARSGERQDLLLLLTTRLINTVYSYGNAAPETLPAAFAIIECAEAICSKP